jgi:hypothetical protein
MRNPMRLALLSWQKGYYQRMVLDPRCGITFAFWEFCCAYSEAVFSSRRHPDGYSLLILGPATL